MIETYLSSSDIPYGQPDHDCNTSKLMQFISIITDNHSVRHNINLHIIMVINELCFSIFAVGKSVCPY